MPDSVGVDDPVDGREVKKLKSDTGSHQKYTSYPKLYVRTIRPEWSPGFLKNNHMNEATNLCRKNQASQDIQLRPPEATLTFTEKRMEIS